MSKVSPNLSSSTCPVSRKCTQVNSSPLRLPIPPHPQCQSIFDPMRQHSTKQRIDGTAWAQAIRDATRDQFRDKGRALEFSHIRRCRHERPRARHGSLRGRNSRLPQDRRSGLARASAARRARRAAHRMCAVQFALISTICPSFSLNMTGYSPQMRGKWWSDIEFSLSRLSTAQTPWPRPYNEGAVRRVRRCARTLPQIIPRECVNVVSMLSKGVY